MLVPQIKFPICSAKPNGKFVNHERNELYNSHFQVKDFSVFDETDFFSNFYKKLKMVLNNMKSEIRKYLGYGASFYKVSEQNLQAAYHAVLNKKSFIEVENLLYSL